MIIVEHEALEELVKKMIQAVGSDDWDGWLDAGNRYDYFLQPITDIHLNSNLSGEYEANSNKTFVYFFALVGIFILLMARAWWRLLVGICHYNILVALKQNTWPLAMGRGFLMSRTWNKFKML